MRSKKIMVLCLAIFGMAVAAFAQGPASLLEGEVSGFKHCTVTLFRNIKGVQQKYAENSLTTSDNRFAFGFAAAEDGEFVRLLITSFEWEGFKEKDQRHYQVELYVKHASTLNLSLVLQPNELQSSLPECRLVGSSPENTILLGWQQRYQQFRVASNAQDADDKANAFAAAYTKYRPGLSAYIKDAACPGNRKFEQTFCEAATARLQLAPIDFYGANAAQLETADLAASFQQIMKQAYTDLQAYCGDALFRVEGINNLSRYYHWLYREKNKATHKVSTAAAGGVPEDSVKSVVCNKTVQTYMGARPGVALSPVADTTRWIGLPPLANKARMAYVRVQLAGFTVADDFTITAFEKVSNRTLISVRATDNYLLVPVLLHEPTVVAFDIFDLRAKLYLKPGDSADLRIYNVAAAGQKARAQYAIRQGSAENRMLAAWYAYAAPVTRYLQPSMTRLTPAETSAFPTDYNQVQSGLEAFLATQPKAADTGFYNLYRQLTAFDLRLSALTFLAKTHAQSGYTGPHFKGFEAAKVPDFYKPFSEGSILCAPGIFRLPDAHQLVSYIARLQWALMPAADRERVPVGAKLGYQLAQLCSPEAKSCLLNWDMRATEPTNWREVRLNLLPNQALLTTNDMQWEYDRVVNTLAMDTQFIGKPILDDAFADTSGRMVRFSQFRGKVVFVDVWATWCAPCREQLPHLLKLEEEYRNNPDIVFVGLSVDREKDHAKWKKFIATEKLQGVQLIDFSGRIFQRPYAIEAIPRFILIDRAGKIAEMRSPYPADGKELKRYLDELLVKGAE